MQCNWLVQWFFWITQVVHLTAVGPCVTHSQSHYSSSSNLGNISGNISIRIFPIESDDPSPKESRPSLETYGSNRWKCRVMCIQIHVILSGFSHGFTYITRARAGRVKPSISQEDMESLPVWTHRTSHFLIALFKWGRCDSLFWTHSHHDDKEIGCIEAEVAMAGI